LRPALQAGRLSDQLGYLARQHFWTVALLGTLPLLLTYVLESAGSAPGQARGIMAGMDDLIVATGPPGAGVPASCAIQDYPVHLPRLRR
jgi:hypothetical protein